MSSPAADVPKPRRARRRYVHLATLTKLPDGSRHVVHVRLDRASSVLEWRPRWKGPHYSIPLSRALELLMRRLDVELAQSLLDGKVLPDATSPAPAP